MKSKTKQLEEKVAALEKKVDELERNRWLFFQPTPYYVPYRIYPTYPIYPLPVWPMYPWCSGGNTLELGNGALTVSSGTAQFTASNVEPSNFVIDNPDVQWSYTSWQA